MLAIETGSKGELKEKVKREFWLQKTDAAQSVVCQTRRVEVSQRE
jgi:hypothetical protein